MRPVHPSSRRNRALTISTLVATWKLWDKNRDRTSWDLVVINPPDVFGPTIHEVTTPASVDAGARRIIVSAGMPPLSSSIARSTIVEITRRLLSVGLLAGRGVCRQGRAQGVVQVLVVTDWEEIEMYDIVWIYAYLKFETKDTLPQLCFDVLA
ncbi:hypothetical protein BV22DRAFT_1128758 [Leucogyrophana mollusca]|uniref:Uncharacterized protein n=1 Tax=Leucogyrophana mollusca TaxID=85980 RepID=A0ACB8BJ38_9AGAM|nr:hypothetical protein BV22DRAFT_1128758 [Leucogyrophana mollusca]